MRKAKIITISLDDTKFILDTKGKFTESDYLTSFMALTKHVSDDSDCDFFQNCRDAKIIVER